MRQRRDVTAPEPCSSEDDQSARITSSAPTISELHRRLGVYLPMDARGGRRTEHPWGDRHPNADGCGNPLFPALVGEDGGQCEPGNDDAEQPGTRRDNSCVAEAKDPG